jgi:hypothetical protein
VADYGSFELDLSPSAPQSALVADNGSLGVERAAE